MSKSLQNLFSAAGIICCLLIFPGNVTAQEDPTDYFQIQKQLNDTLFFQKKKFHKLVKKTQQTKTTDAADAKFKIALFMRAGMTKATLAAVQDLKRLAPKLNNHDISQIYCSACDRYENWFVAKDLVDTFAENISEIDIRNRLIKYFQSQRWSVGKIDHWLADKPDGVDHFWLKTRLRFNKEYHQERPIIRSLTDAVKQDPDDINNVQTYLEMLTLIKSGDYQEQNLDWMPKKIKPQRATDAHVIAMQLFRLSNFSAARHFFSEALRIPLTDGEIQDKSSRMQVIRATNQIKTAFKVSTLEAYAKCMVKLRDVTAAQKLMLRANQLRKKHNLNMNFFLAGEIQGQSGQRIIENKIQKKEIREKDSPQYWHERALYYRGRKEGYKESQAIKKGLALTSPHPQPEKTRKGYTDWRSVLLNDYIHYLKRQNKIKEALQLILTEIAQSPPESISAKRAVHALCFDYPQHINIDDENLWKWLSQRPKWEYIEERLLWEMLKKAPAHKLLNYMIKAEKLAKGNDPTRAFALGWILNRMNQPVRSITLLKEAMANAPDEKFKRKTIFTLFESYLDIKDWVHAERIFPEAARQLTPGEMTDWYARIAVAAAESGDFKDAIRIWESLANINPSAIHQLEAMLQAGLKEELTAFYKIMVFRLPHSTIPKKALLMIKAKK
ncbi:MAG: hypothetical protein K8S27_00870 [Candidatus Omnitrophica bacterium]|nr:hypothetical protein [Candidatus Omnitrophota bacterium]